jgi:hypothetical protein
MEFLLVIFKTECKVIIDGVQAGLTNHLITLAPGTYTVSLASPRRFRPRDHDVVVEDTSPLDPIEVRFV